MHVMYGVFCHTGNTLDRKIITSVRTVLEKFRHNLLYLVESQSVLQNGIYNFHISKI